MTKSLSKVVVEGQWRKLRRNRQTLRYCERSEAIQSGLS